MKYVLMKSSEEVKKPKKIMPLEKKREAAQKRKEETEKVKAEDLPEKDVDAAQIEVNDNEISKEIKKRTDVVLKGYLKANPPIPLTYIGFDKDMNAVVEGVLNDQDVRKRDKERRRREKIKEGKKKLFQRRENGQKSAK